MSNPDQEIIVIDGTPNETTQPVKPNPISDAITSHIQMTQTNKKVPNIAQELAMNRNNSRTLSPSAPIIPTTPFKTKLMESAITETKEQVKQKTKQNSKPKPKSKSKVEPKIATTPNSPSVSDDKTQQLKQVRIASLLSTGEEPKTTSLEKSVDMTKKMPSNLRFKQDSPSPSDISKLLSPPAKTAIPIVPIAKASSAQKKPTETKPVEKKIIKQTTVTVVPKKKVVTLTNKPVLKRTKSNSVTTGSNTTSSTGSKKNSTTAATKASKSKSATSLDSIKKKATTKKSQYNDKKKNPDNATKTAGSSSTTNKAPAVPEASKLVAAPLIGDAKLLSKTSSVSEKDEPISIVDIPLYSTTSNEYLDENGTVTFNLFRILKQNEPKLDTKQEKDLKRKRLFNQDMDSKENNLTDVDDIIDDDEDMEDNAETDKTETQPKKKAHPMKGKNLIGKYDFEDPFIDDSEMLWEEQRASTKDGFFVFFGPLIAKGQSASFERADGTMKRGGIKK
ncbi:hypothetical protein C6P45_004488 [Maudiozyma exigua]|uniref:Hpc2-related domain-containing protein n=1 Tax=Maudiozyma exigua TaxID=34358 RepID=A0A9P7BB63_MAUEX|nr:hypothetical protein C6P45_004488 [Kazachstania exigua]